MEGNEMDKAPTAGEQPFTVDPPQSGIIPIRHGLGTMALTARCEGVDGAPVGFLGAVPIDVDNVEVATAPGVPVAVVYLGRRDTE